MANFIQNLRAIVNRVRETLFRGLFRARFRYDVFISYSHSDAKEYAFNLKQQLSNLDFACFIDKEESPPGLSLGPTLEKALKRSAVLVLLATERALTRPYIHQEFETFVAAGRKIIPINILDALTKNNEEVLATAPWKTIKEQKLIWIDEAAEAFAKQQPSPPIADGIDKLFKYTRRNVRVRTEVIGTAVLVLLAAFGAGFIIKGQAAEVAKQASLADLAKQETQKQQTIAAQAGDEARKQLALADQARQDAETQTRLANEARDEAAKQQQIAKEATAEATKQQLLARQATLEAQRQQAIAEQQLQRSRNLLYDSDINLAQRAQERGDMPQLSEFLNNHVPDKTQSDLRGFEWFYYWRLANYKPEVLGSVDYVGNIEISRDGKVLAAVSNDSSGQLKIWQLNGPRESVEVKAHRDRVTDLAISWDGTTVATASADTTIKIWDIRTRDVKLIKTLQNDRVSVVSVVFSRDGKMLATGGSNKTVRLWDLEKETPLMTSSPYTESVFYPALSPDGNTLVTYDDKTIKLQSTKPPYQMIDEFPTNEKIGCVSFSADGKKLIAGVTGKVRIMDWPDYRSVRLLDAPANACPIALSGDGSSMTIMGNTGNKIYLWNVQPWGPLGSFNVDGWFSMAILTPDGRRVAVRRSSDVMLWDVRGVQEQATIDVGNGVDQMAFSGSGKMLAVLGDKTVGLWDTETRKELPRLDEMDYGALSIALSRGGTMATGYDDGTVKLWNVESRKPASVIKICTKEVLALSFSPDEQTLAAGCSDGKIELWNTRTQKPITLNGHSGPIRSLVFSADGKLASGSEDKTVRVWDGTTGQQLWVSDVHKDVILAVAFSSDARKLASASKDKTVKLWDVGTAQELVTLVGHKFEVSAVAFSPDGKTVATGSVDETIKLWDPNTGQERTTFTQHASRVAAVAFSPDGQTLATGSWDGTVKLWFAATDKEVNAAAQRKP